MLIKEVHAKEILDSRKMPTVFAQLITSLGTSTASVPSGTSRGKYEALELRDQDSSVRKAIDNIKKIITPRIINKNFKDQQEIDNLMIKLDGTKNKKRLGANAILAISMAACRAFAKENKMPLYRYIQKMSVNKNKLKMPKPMILLFEGGKHANNAIGREFQEFMIIPEEKKMADNVKTGKKIYENVGSLLRTHNVKKKIGLEGAYFSIGNEQSLQCIADALKKAKARCSIAIDVAASGFFTNESYRIAGRIMDKEELTKVYARLIKKYPLLSIEDPFDQDDWNAWKSFSKKSVKNIMIVGDDFLTTNPDRIKKAIKEKACNAMILKINQIGTITEAISASHLAKKAGWKVIVSHRSGETQDDFIADLAVGIGAEYTKFGAVSKKERMTKYSRLVEIEKEI